MNQGKWEVVKQEMVRINIDISGISELKWTRMGEFNSDDHYIYYCGQESLRRNGVGLIVNKGVQYSPVEREEYSPQETNTVLGCNLKSDRMISDCFQGKPFNITVIQVHAPITNAEESEDEQFYDHLQDLLEVTPKKKDVLFNTGYWNSKLGSQEITGVTGKFGLKVQNEAGQRLSLAKRTHWTQQTPSSNNTREDSTHGPHQMVNTEIRLIIFFAAKDGEALYS